MEHYLVEVNIVQEIGRAKVVVQAKSLKEAEDKAKKAVYNHYNTDENRYTPLTYALYVEAEVVHPDEVAEHDLNTLVDLEEY